MRNVSPKIINNYLSRREKKRWKDQVEQVNNKQQKQQN